MNPLLLILIATCAGRKCYRKDRSVDHKNNHNRKLDFKGETHGLLDASIHGTVEENGRIHADVRAGQVKVPIDAKITNANLSISNTANRSKVKEKDRSREQLDVHANVGISLAAGTIHAVKAALSALVDKVRLPRSQNFQEDCINSHNIFREMIGMQPLQYDMKLASQAMGTLLS